MRDQQAVGRAAPYISTDDEESQIRTSEGSTSRYRRFVASSYHPDAHRANRGGKYFQTIIHVICLIQLAVVWYAAAIFFPPEYRWNRSMQGLFWMEGALIRGNGTDTVCPKETLCSVGWGEISLLMVSRLTAFMMYVTIMLVFFTKCHSMTHFLARTYVAELIPIEYLHRTHKNQGMLFFVLAVLHTLGHLVRWALRAELSRMLLKTVGMSGIFAMLLMVVIVAPMAAPALKRRLSFELRISLHAGRHVEVLLLALLLLHATRAGVITLILAGVWMLDRLYMLLYRTHRLNTVELTRLHEGGDKDESVGVQMLWKNPEGFNPTSGEYVLIQFPWLEEGGGEWHAFSMYMREATKEGLSIARPGMSPRASIAGGGRVHRAASVRTSIRRSMRESSRWMEVPPAVSEEPMEESVEDRSSTRSSFRSALTEVVDHTFDSSGLDHEARGGEPRSSHGPPFN